MGCGCKDILLGKVGRSMAWPSQTFEPPTTAFTTGKIVSGLLTFDCVTLEVGGTARIHQVALWESATTGTAQKGALDLILFTKSQTIVTGNSYAAPATFTEIITVIPITSGDYVDVDTAHSLALVEPPACEIRAAPDTSTIYGVLVARGSITYAADAGITVQLRMQRD